MGNQSMLKTWMVVLVSIAVFGLIFYVSVVYPHCHDSYETEYSYYTSSTTVINFLSNSSEVPIKSFEKQMNPFNEEKRHLQSTQENEIFEQEKKSFFIEEGTESSLYSVHITTVNAKRKKRNALSRLAAKKPPGKSKILGVINAASVPIAYRPRSGNVVVFSGNPDLRGVQFIPHLPSMKSVPTGPLTKFKEDLTPSRHYPNRHLPPKIYALIV
ncbi:uncharacterized protein LOC136028809 isoform X2 [Artemia franciscana]|uniref:uncharacterized protein LOC136028809 isoform X2 n=1 Tax=Artemia franciscana TaxID=6661 RepID=UPI0032DB9EF9